jgi:dTDP-4-dehydrorhamnose reductase
VTRWLVTGAGGLLGSDVVDVLTAYGEPVVGYGHADLDVTDRSSVTSGFARSRPDVVVNCAAYTAVDAAESDADAAALVNVEGARLVAETCASVGARLIHVSTDYVFDGSADAPYAEDATVTPLSVYGRTKAAGEQAVLSSGARAYVVRSSWLYGYAGPSFVRTMARAARADAPVRVVEDQVGIPTWTLHLARALIALGVADVAPGVWHCANDGSASWFVFARAIFAELGLDPARVEPVATATFPRPAPRPAYSVLSTRKWRAAGLPELPHWRDALAEAFETLGEELTDD